MSTTRAQKTRLGLFAIAAAAALALVLVVFGGMRFWERRDTYVIYFDDSVMGLERGADVMFAGIRVGRVEKIELVPDDLQRVKVTVELERGLPVRTDTEATLQFAGITGLKQIDLRGGTAGAGRLPPGGTIRTGETVLDRFERTAEKLADRSEELMDGAGKVMENLERTSIELHAMVSENRTALRGTIAAVGQAARNASAVMENDLPKLVGNAGILVDDLRGMVRANEAHVRTAMFDLRQASRNFKDLSRELRQRPSRILFSQAARDRKLP
jgi:phospholipid/cholesterol/gamma-HCH transport system substrate-binding protein